jgi:hypothetical protein
LFGTLGEPEGFFVLATSVALWLRKGVPGGFRVGGTNWLGCVSSEMTDVVSIISTTHTCYRREKPCSERPRSATGTSRWASIPFIWEMSDHTFATQLLRPETT